MGHLDLERLWSGSFCDNSEFGTISF